MRVAIIDMQNGEIKAYGECDGKRYDDMYLKVYRDNISDKSAAMTLTFAASVFPEDIAENISKELKFWYDKKVKADNAYSKRMYELANEFKAFPR